MIMTVARPSVMLPPTERFVERLGEQTAVPRASRSGAIFR